MYNFAVLGAGSIGYQCDLNTDHVRSHAKGISANGFNIAAFIDASASAAEKAASAYDTNYYVDLESCLISEDIDYLTIAVPDSLHYEVFKQLSIIVHRNPKVKNGLKGVLLEKPIASELEHAHEMVKMIKALGIQCKINYFRRFLPSMNKIKSRINNHEFGKLIFGRVIYDKGLMHNASHWIDLIQHFFGELKVKSVMDRVPSVIEGDDNYDFILSVGENKNIIFQSGNSNYYTVFELELYFQNKVIKIQDFGRKITFYDIHDDEIAGYRSAQKTEEIETEYKHSADYVIRSLVTDKDLGGLMDGLNNMVLCRQVKDSHESFGVCS